MVMRDSLFLPVIIRDGVTVTSSVSSDGRASWSMPIDVSPLDGAIWSVNPDAGSVTIIDEERLETIAEIVIGTEPWSLTVAPDGKHVYIVDRATGELVVLDALTYTVAARLIVGPELGGVALSPSGDRAYLTSSVANELLVIDTATTQITARIAVDAMPYALAISDDGDGEDRDERLYLTHFFARPRPHGIEATDDGREGRISIIDLATEKVLTQTVLAPNATGFPNLLTSITTSGDWAWAPHVRAAPDLPNGLTTRVFAAISVLNTKRQTEESAAYLPLNDQDLFGSPVNNPVAAIPSPDGKRLYVVLAGSDLIEVIDISTPQQPRLEKFIAVGMNPRGMALNSIGSKGYVMNYLSRSISVIDLQTLAVTAVITTTAEPLSPTLLRGKILFNNAVNPKLSQGSWVSCASCHPDGGTDSVTWMFPDGPRQTPPLWNAGQTLPWHWSAALDEPQDVEDTIHVIQLGLGLAPGADPALLGTPNAGRAADLDALADFMRQGIRPPEVKVDPNAAAGRTLFSDVGCVNCHGGPTWTTSQLPGAPGDLDPDGNGMVDGVIQEVGVHNVRDVRGATGFDAPTLLGVGLSAPYLHDGSAATIPDLLRSGHPNPHNGGNGLSETEITQLSQFLHSLDGDTKPITAP
jgi:YVTN family beta-propeller protein